MKNASAEVLFAPETSSWALSEKLVLLGAAAHAISVLIAAASALILVPRKQTDFFSSDCTRTRLAHQIASAPNFPRLFDEQI